MKAHEECHNEAFRTALDKGKDEVSGVMNQKQPTREAIVDAAAAIREAMDLRIAERWRGY